MNLRSVFLGALATLCTFAAAQFPGGYQMPEVKYLPTLLLMPNVQKELGLSPAVAKKVQATIMQQGMSMLPLMGAQRNQMTPSQQQAMVQKMIQAYRKMEANSVADLSPAQKARLHQLTLQAEGSSALLQPSVGGAVGITPAQKAQLTQAITAQAQGMAATMKRGNYQNLLGMQEQMRVQSERAANKVLTPVQQRKWAAMKGRTMSHLMDFGGMMPGFGGH